jgi:hypothetical protein
VAARWDRERGPRGPTARRAPSFRRTCEIYVIAGSRRRLARRMDADAERSPGPSASRIRIARSCICRGEGSLGLGRWDNAPGSSGGLVAPGPLIGPAFAQTERRRAMWSRLATPCSQLPSRHRRKMAPSHGRGELTRWVPFYRGAVLAGGGDHRARPHARLLARAGDRAGAPP